MTQNEIRKAVVDAAIEVHREIGGPGLIESTRDEALVEELPRYVMKVEPQLHAPVIHKGKRSANPLRLDLKVNNFVLVENKAATERNPIFETQMLTCLCLTKIKPGLVFNFGRQYEKNGNHRVVNGP